MTVQFLKLNEEKTEFIIFSPSRCTRPFSSTTITVGDDTVLPVNIVRNLGSFFDRHMSMDHHVSQVIKSSHHQLRRIRYIRKYLTADATERLVHAFVTSKLDINNGLLAGAPGYRIKSLQHVQNAAVRLITGTRRYDHITQSRQSLHWLPVKSRIDFKICLLVYKCLNGLAPQYLIDCLSRLDNPRTLRSSGSTQLRVPKARVKIGQGAFSVCGPKLWNKLPPSVRSAASLDIFKSRLKTHLYK